MNGVVFTENDKPTIVSTGNSLLSMNTWNMPTYGAYSLFLSIRMNVRRADMFLGHIGNAQLSISRNTSGTNRYYGSANITVAALPNGNNYITITNVSNSVSAWENGTQIMNKQLKRTNTGVKTYHMCKDISQMHVTKNMVR